MEPHQQVPEGLWAGDDVERRRQRAALIKVTHPQLGAGKLPLNVSMVLEDKKSSLNSGRSFFFFFRMQMLLRHGMTGTCFEKSYIKIRGLEGFSGF